MAATRAEQCRCGVAEATREATRSRERNYTDGCSPDDRHELHGTFHVDRKDFEAVRIRVHQRQHRDLELHPQLPQKQPATAIVTMTAMLDAGIVLDDATCHAIAWERKHAGVLRCSRAVKGQTGTEQEDSPPAIHHCRQALP